MREAGKIPIGFLIYQLHRAIHQNINQSFAKAGIPIGIEQWQVMMELFNSNGLSQQFLADKTKKDKTTLTRLINNLEKNGLAVRKPDRQDKRKKLIFHTDKAFQLKENIISELQGFNQRLLKNVQAEEEIVFRKVINDFFMNLNWEFDFMSTKCKSFDLKLKA